MATENEINRELLNLILRIITEDEREESWHRQLSQLSEMSFRVKDPEINRYLLKFLRDPFFYWGRYRRISEHVGFVESQTRELQAKISGVREESSERLAQLQGMIENTNRQMQKEINALKKDLEAQVNEISQKQVQAEWLAINEIDPKNIKESKFLPVRVYLADPIISQSTLSNVKKAIAEFAEQNGFLLDKTLFEEKGSWWAKLRLKSKKVMNTPEFQSLAAKMKRAAELQALEKPQAETTKMLSESVAGMLKSIENEKSAVINVGNILIVKTCDSNDQSHIAVKTLNAMEILAIESNSTLLKSPNTILAELSNCSWPELNSTRLLDSLKSDDPPRLPPPS